MKNAFRFVLNKLVASIDNDDYKDYYHVLKALLDINEADTIEVLDEVNDEKVMYILSEYFAYPCFPSGDIEYRRALVRVKERFKESRYRDIVSRAEETIALIDKYK